jgi:alpha-mannosidase
LFKNKANAKNFEQIPLKLDFNYRMIGPQGDQNCLFPAELTPSTISAGNISYRLAVQEKLNALQCQGQKVRIPEGYNTLSILIGSTDGCDGSFKLENQEGNIIENQSYHISPLTGFVGQWDKRRWLFKPKHHLKYKRDYAWINKCVGVEPGYVNRDRIEWYATHTHKNGEDQPYQYGYMYSITILVPAGTTTLALPDDKRIFIFAITASKQEVQLQSAQLLRDKFDF